MKRAREKTYENGKINVILLDCYGSALILFIDQLIKRMLLSYDISKW